MRKQPAYLVVASALAAALTFTGVAGGVTAVQTLEGKFTPNKLPKKQYKNGAIEVTVSATDADNPSGLPPKATRAEIFFDDDGRVNPGAVPTCQQNEIENTTTEAAKAACGPSQVGGGSAVAALPFGPGGTRTDFPVTVTAFNGAGGTLLLHSRVDQLGTTVVLPGEYKRASGRLPAESAPSRSSPPR
jgi:hypothetical protein